MLIIKVKKETFIDVMLLLIIYLQLVILEFFGFGQTLNKVVTVLILMRLIFSRSKHPMFVQLSGIGLILLYAASTFLSQSIELSNALSNFSMQFYPFVYAYYFYFLCRTKPDFIDQCFDKSFWLFNITMVVNIIVLLKQIFQPFSVNAVITSNVINFYQDTISGLFAYASTHVVCLFSIFVILYNLTYWKKLKNEFAKVLITIYLIAICGVSIFISLNNDNKAFFLFLPLSFLVFLLVESSYLSKKRFNKAMITIFFVPLALWALYSFIEPIGSLIDDNILNTLDLISKATSLGNAANGSNERIAIIGYAFNTTSTWLIGEGFGSTFIYQSGFHGFNHFGQADLGSLLVLGGVWYTAILFYYYTKLSYGIVIGNSNRSSKILMVGIFSILLFTMVYTQCFTRTNTVICLIFIMFAFRMRYSGQKIH